MLDWIRFGLTVALTLPGLFLMAVAVVAQYRFHYVLNRMHAAAMNDTLGILFVLLSLIVAEGATFTSLKLVLVILMLWITSPVSSHLVCRLEITTNEHIEREMEVHK